MENASTFMFELSGLNDSLTNRGVYFGVALTSYAVTVFFNLSLVVTIAWEKTLHQPMYVFLANICINGICGASSFYPKLLQDLLSDSRHMSYTHCLLQMCGIYCYVFCEFTSLTVMAFDRYVAICRPLQYRGLMTRAAVTRLVALTWSFSLVETAVGAVLTSRLPLCGNRLPKFFCTNWEVVKLSCVDTTVNNIYGFLLVVSHLLQTALILVSYVGLVRAALRSRADRRKFAQTCLPHLVALLIFASSICFDSMFSRYGRGVPGMRTLSNALAAEFLVVPPLLNPIIYGIKMQQIRAPIMRHFRPRDEPQKVRLRLRDTVRETRTRQ
ncbi:olfactory receptor 4E1-like [Boleophthalmus pectinirostris]|uniref:olfactory receptor 4E1-like n=1 Tax=Boleophthalmus pectinirostris TaxID=150288 RepID=UPI000A1C4168|nr:olfactory receptor 4E1-like [Boleophthalmus pectinirostris]